MDVDINFWAVLGGAVSAMIVGSIWYAKPVFGTEWQKLVRLKDNDLKSGAVMALSIMFVLALVTAYVVAHVAFLSKAFFDISYVQAGIQTGFWLWLGISMTALLGSGIFEHRRKKLMAINIGNQLVTLIVMGAVIGWLS